ncbi:hypothetical protein [Flavobacterium pallidum]|uniref:Uncharacterized protein n=1 Tax=Flavobacterium pallidum TaxID=2172098 RepID=A0A2S1SKN8_9FLAO|nr:hypothetical protein [Flavobacterium pallidum]AWI26949.1 hypothetical protein HYN49_14130 [Flavobacterium pallidum]
MGLLILLLILAILTPLTLIISLIVYLTTKNEATKKTALTWLNTSLIIFLIGFGGCIAMLYS